MPATLSSNVRASVNWTYTNPSTVIGNTTNQAGFSFTDSMATGTGADLNDLLYLGSPTIAASGSLTLDLAGSLLDLFGNVLTFARVKGFWISFQDANIGTDISVGDAGSAQFFGFFNAAADKEKVNFTGCFFKYRSDATGWPVTATTADKIKISNLDAVNPMMLNIAIFGCSV